MGFHFTIGALALASEGANAVGAVRFTMRDEALEVDLLRVGSYRESFLPGALTESVRFAVPYTAVRGLVRRGPVLYLALDPKVASPYHRFALTRFTDGPMDALIGAHHRRMRARLGAVLLPAPLSTLALVVAPEWAVSGALGKASLAVVVALATWAACRAALSARTYGGPLTDEFRDAFEQRLLERLGLRPAWLADEAPFDAPMTHAMLARAESAPRPLRGAALGFPVAPPAPLPTPSRGATPARPRTMATGRSRFVEEPPSFPAVATEPGGPPPGFPEEPIAVPSRRPVSSPATRAALALRRETPAPEPLPAAPVPPAEPGPPGPLPLAQPSPVWAVLATSRGAKRAAAGILGAAALAVLALSAGRAVLEPVEPEPVAAAGTDDAAPPGAPGAPTGDGSAGPTTSAAAAAAPRSPLPRCTCERSDSPLWATPPALLTIIPIPTRRNELGALEDDIAPRPDRRGRMRYEFDLAIVNNGKDDLADITTVLTFARRDERNERVGVTDRGLFWEGVLGPARSVKWTVKAPGTEVRIDADEKRTLADVAPASGDAFFALLRARQPAVRLHAATMLAYVGDPRAEAAAKGLDGLSASQEVVREMVVRAASPVRVCAVKVKGDTLEACVDNATDAPVSRPTLVEPSENGRDVTLDDTVPPHDGLRATFPGFGPAPAELFVRR